MAEPIDELAGDEGGKRQDYDAGNPGQVGEREKRAKERRMRAEDGFKKLLETQNGRAWLWSLLEELQPFGTIFTKADPLVLAYNAGQKDVGLKLLGKLTKPEFLGSFTMMMEEAKK